MQEKGTNYIHVHVMMYDHSNSAPLFQTDILLDYVQSLVPNTWANRMGIKIVHR